MKTLVIYYSRTGTTRTVAKQIAQKLNCDSEEIIDEKNRRGVLGFLLAGRDTMLNKLTVIKKINADLSAYDLIIIGGPVWVGNMSVPIRTFISRYKEHFKRVAFFCTHGGGGASRAFKRMETLLGGQAVTYLEISAGQIKNNSQLQLIEEFIIRIKQLL